MKKMLFSAIAMVAFAGSAFAGNEMVLENLPTKAENQRIESASWRD